MDNLPIEIQRYIFLLLSQRNLSQCSIVSSQWYQIVQPILYSTLKLYSCEQWKKFVNTAKIVTIQDKPVIYYVHHIIIYFNAMLFYDYISEFSDTLPNLQSVINGLYNSSLPLPSMSIRFPILKQLTHIPIWYKTSFEQISDKKRIKSIHYKIENLPFSPSLEVSSKTSSNNYLYPIGPIKCRKRKILSTEYETGINVNQRLENLLLGSMVRLNNNNNEEPDIKYQRLVLRLPLLESLTHLHLCFESSLWGQGMYEYDDRFLNTLHLSCPRLEKLSLYHFFMNLSEQYDNSDVFSNPPTIQPLKELTISGILKDPKCYTLLSLKYPQLKSFNLDLLNYSSLLDRNLPFSSFIQDMIIKFTLLKKLSLGVNYGRTRRFNKENDIYIFPDHEFFQWLQKHPKQLDHLSYPNPLILQPHVSTSHQQRQLQQNMDNFQSIKSIPLNDVVNDSFLNYLTSLSLEFNHFVETAINYLLINKHTTTLSISINEIFIYNMEKENKSIIYIYDWLTILPNLLFFSVKDIDFINDYDDRYDNIKNKIYIKDRGKENDMKLHELILQRKQQQKKQKQKQNNTDNNNEDIHGSTTRKKTYSLRKLVLENGHFHFNHDFNSFIKTFGQLNDLTLHNIDFSYYDEKQQLKLLQELQRQQLITRRQPSHSFDLFSPTHSYESLVNHPTLSVRTQNDPLVVARRSSTTNDLMILSNPYDPYPDQHSFENQLISNNQMFEPPPPPPSTVFNTLQTITPFSYHNNIRRADDFSEHLTTMYDFTYTFEDELNFNFSSQLPQSQSRETLQQQQPSSSSTSSTINVSDNVKQINLNMSHLKLDKLSIIQFGFLPWGTNRKASDRYSRYLLRYNRHVVEKINVYYNNKYDKEFSIFPQDKDSVVGSYISEYSQFRKPCIINLTCDFIDEFIFYKYADTSNFRI
ncbi:unnamed protein product [Cunninghamella blakesleeana]